MHNITISNNTIKLLIEHARYQYGLIFDIEQITKIASPQLLINIELPLIYRKYKDDAFKITALELGGKGTQEYLQFEDDLRLYFNDYDNRIFGRNWMNLENLMYNELQNLLQQAKYLHDKGIKLDYNFYYKPLSKYNVLVVSETDENDKEINVAHHLPKKYSREDIIKVINAIKDDYYNHFKGTSIYRDFIHFGKSSFKKWNFIEFEYWFPNWRTTFLF